MVRCEDRVLGLRLRDEDGRAVRWHGRLTVAATTRA